jgi:pentatricopeptide repeat protein
MRKTIKKDNKIRSNDIELSTPKQRSSYHKRNQQQYFTQQQRPLQSLNKNLHSLATSGQVGAAARAQELLQRIEALHHEGYYAVKPDVSSYNAVLNAWAKAFDDPEATQRAMELLNDMQPNLISYNTLLWGLCQRGMISEALRVFQRMQDDYTPDLITYNSLLYGHAQANQPHEAHALLQQLLSSQSTHSPDIISWNTVLYAWTKTGHATKAHQVLQLLQQQHKAGNLQVAPDVYSYTTVLSSMTTSQDALALWRDMQQAGIPPTVVTYTTLFDVLSKSSGGDHLHEAQALVQHLLESGHEVDTAVLTAAMACLDEHTALKLWETLPTQADPRTYTQLLKAVSLPTALRLLQELPGLNVIHYNVVISKMEDNVVLARSVYQDMSTRHVSPTLVTYHALLRVCCASNEAEALPMAVQLMDSLWSQSTLEPTSVTMVMYLKVLRKHGQQKEQPERLKQVVEYCTNRGLWNDYVLDQVQRALPGDDLAQQLGLVRLETVADLPSSWTANAQPIRTKVTL